MHHFYTLLAIDLANERAREAQARFERNRLLADSGQTAGIRRRLTDAARGMLSMFDGAAPAGGTADPAPPRCPGAPTGSTSSGSVRTGP